MFEFFAMLALGAALIILTLAVLGIMRPDLVLWPPAHFSSWENRCFRFLFRVMVYGLLAASAHNIWMDGFPASLYVNVIAGLLFLIGFSIAFAATFSLGWRNAFGAKEGLRTDGIYRYSRNPIYLATWFGLAGWALLVSTNMIVLGLFAWALIYIFAVFLEERWLAKEYGAAFDIYCKNVRRFI